MSKVKVKCEGLADFTLKRELRVGQDFVKGYFILFHQRTGELNGILCEYDS